MTRKEMINSLINLYSDAAMRIFDNANTEFPNSEIDENSPIGLAIADYITKHLKLDKEEMDGIPYITLSWETKDKHKPIDYIAII